MELPLLGYQALVKIVRTINFLFLILFPSVMTVNYDRYLNGLEVAAQEPNA